MKKRHYSNSPNVRIYLMKARESESPPHSPPSTDAGGTKRDFALHVLKERCKEKFVVPQHRGMKRGMSSLTTVCGVFPKQFSLLLLWQPFCSCVTLLRY